MNKSKSQSWNLVADSFQELDADYELAWSSSDSDKDISIETITQPAKKYKTSNCSIRQNKVLDFSQVTTPNKVKLLNPLNELPDNNISDISSADDLDILEISPCPSPEPSCSEKVFPSITSNKSSLHNVQNSQKRKRRLVKGGFAAQLDKILKRTRSSVHFWKYERIRGFSEQDEIEQDTDSITEEFGRLLVNCKSGDVLIIDPDVIPRRYIESSFSMCPTIKPFILSIDNKNYHMYLGVNKIAAKY